jgi:cytoskeletal protein RodZ
MKRCPECQFLYENETIQCDMDGTPLRYTMALPSIPGLAKSIWDRWTIALLCAVILGTVLVILYRATPSAYTSASPAQVDSIKGELPPTNQDAQTSETAAPSESSAEEQAIDASETSDDSNDPFDSQSTTIATKLQKAKRGAPLSDQQETSPAPMTHFEPAASLPAAAASSTAAKPVTTAIGPVEKTTPSQTASSSTTSASAHPDLPKGIRANPPPKTKKRNQASNHSSRRPAKF